MVASTGESPTSITPVGAAGEGGGPPQLINNPNPNPNHPNNFQHHSRNNPRGSPSITPVGAAGEGWGPPQPSNRPRPNPSITNNSRAYLSPP
jgi:hypothetical protein